MKNALTIWVGRRGFEAPEERHIYSSIRPAAVKPRRGDMFCSQRNMPHLRRLGSFGGTVTINNPALAGPCVFL